MGWEKVGMSGIQERNLWGIVLVAPFLTLGFIFTGFILGTMVSPVSTQSVSGPDSLAARVWSPTLLSQGFKGLGDRVHRNLNWGGIIGHDNWGGNGSFHMTSFLTLDSSLLASSSRFIPRHGNIRELWERALVCTVDS